MSFEVCLLIHMLFGVGNVCVCVCFFNVFLMYLNIHTFSMNRIGMTLNVKVYPPMLTVGRLDYSLRTVVL